MRNYGGFLAWSSLALVLETIPLWIIYVLNGEAFEFWLVIFDESWGVSITVAGGDSPVGSVPYTVIDVCRLFISQL